MAVQKYRGGDTVFLKACELAKVEPTRRQYKKFLRQCGSAYRFASEAVRVLNSVE